MLALTAPSQSSQSITLGWAEARERDPKGKTSSPALLSPVPHCSPVRSRYRGHRWWPAPPGRRTARTAPAARPSGCGDRTTPELQPHLVPSANTELHLPLARFLMRGRKSPVTAPGLVLHFVLYQMGQIKCHRRQTKLLEWPRVKEAAKKLQRT